MLYTLHSIGDSTPLMIVEAEGHDEAWVKILQGGIRNNSRRLTLTEYL